jgi:cell division protein FtsW (lipid II flippase)
MSFLDWLTIDPTGAREAIAQALLDSPMLFRYFTAASRFVLCLLAVTVVVRCGISLLSGKTEEEVWAYLDLSKGLHLPVTHWENVIGRSRASDVMINYPTISRSHAALIQYDDGWHIFDLESKGGTRVNGQDIAYMQRVEYGDVLEFAGVAAVLTPLSDKELKANLNRTPPGKDIKPSVTLYLLTMFQIILGVKLSIAAGENFVWPLPFCFLMLMAATWLYFLFFRALNRRGFEVDILAFFLATMGLGVTGSSEPDGILMQFIALVAGLALFIGLGWFLRDLNRAQKMRWPAAVATVGLLMITIVFGRVVYGAQNWIFIGGMSIQPSEIAKVTFVYAGAATLDRLFAKRNITLYLGLTGVSALALAYMSDFGAVIIFFVAFLVVAYLRSGNILTIAFISMAAAFGGLIVLRFKPYIAGRFGSWLHAWDAANMHDGGFQQTRTMSAAASGGLFGVGAGEGWLRYIPASDTDLVFGIVVEEYGLIIGAACIACICVLAVFAAKSTVTSRSSFFAIAACCATAMLVFQTTLNVMGSVDILPQTGVTLPFVSNGGSSLVSSFGLLAFIKAADTRQNASFAILPQKKVLRRRGDA